MRKVISGTGADSTAAVLAHLAANRQLILANLFLIGEPDDPKAVWLTDWDTPLLWSAWGTFYPSAIKRSKVSSKIGLEVSTLDVTWSPPLGSFTQSINTTSQYERARLGIYDGAVFRSWTVYMPTKGDANTFGASELFGGRVGNIKTQRGIVNLTINSFLDAVNQMVPTATIELTNTLAQFKAATPPAGLTQIPQFSVIAGSSTTLMICDATFPTPGQLFGTNLFRDGYLVFNAGGTMDGLFSPVRGNLSSGGHNRVTVVAQFPWAPTPGVDTFYLSAPFPINQVDGQYVGFPYVPPPESAIGGG